MHKTKAFGLYACTLCDHMFGSFYLVSIYTVPNQYNRNGRYGYQNMATAGDSSSGNLRVFID